MTTVWVSKGGNSNNTKVYHTRKEHALERILESNLVEFDSDQLEILGYRTCATCEDKAVVSRLDVVIAEAIRAVTYRRPEEYDLPLDKVDEFIDALTYRGFEVKAIPRARREELQDRGVKIVRLTDEEATLQKDVEESPLPEGSRHGRLGPMGGVIADRGKHESGPAYASPGMVARSPY